MKETVVVAGNDVDEDVTRVDIVSEVETTTDDIIGSIVGLLAAMM